MTGGAPCARGLVVAGVLHRGDRVLATRRTRPAALAGLWEFPGGKVEAGETPAQALVRELAEELGIRARVGAELASGRGRWPISETLEMRVFWVTSDDDPHPGEAHDMIRWLSPPDLARMDWVPADIAVAELLQRSNWSAAGRPARPGADAGAP